MSLKEPPLTFYYPIKGNFKSEIANTLMQSKFVLSLQRKLVILIMNKSRNMCIVPILEQISANHRGGGGGMKNM